MLSLLVTAGADPMQVPDTDIHSKWTYDRAMSKTLMCFGYLQPGHIPTPFTFMELIPPAHIRTLQAVLDTDFNCITFCSLLCGVLATKQVEQGFVSCCQCAMVAGVKIVN